MYKIKSLTLENFKSYKSRQTIKFGDLNLFFGKNGSGKSTILDAFKYISNILEYGDQTYPFWGDTREHFFGGFDAVVSDKNCSNCIYLAIKIHEDRNTISTKRKVDKLFPPIHGKLSPLEIKPYYFDVIGEIFILKDKWDQINRRLQGYDNLIDAHMSMMIKEFEIIIKVQKDSINISLNIFDDEYCKFELRKGHLKFRVSVNPEHQLNNPSDYGSHKNDLLLRDWIETLNKDYLNINDKLNDVRDPALSLSVAEWVAALSDGGGSTNEFAIVEMMYDKAKRKGLLASNCQNYSFKELVNLYSDNADLPFMLSDNPLSYIDESSMWDLNRRDSEWANSGKDVLKEHLDYLGNNIEVQLSRRSSPIELISNHQRNFTDEIMQFESRSRKQTTDNSRKKNGKTNYRFAVPQAHKELISRISRPFKDLMDIISSSIEVEEIRPILPNNFTFGVRTVSKKVGAIELWDSIFNGDLDIREVNRNLRLLDEQMALEKIEVIEKDSNGYTISEHASVKIRDTLTQALYSVSEMASGISQILPVLYACLHDEKYILIKQPELHIHPNNQLIVGDLLLESAFKLGNQLFIETHSEHIILRILRRIREQAEGIEYSQCKLYREKINVNYIEKNKKGESIVSRQEITEDGDFVLDWPEGFFEERDEELF